MRTSFVLAAVVCFLAILGQQCGAQGRDPASGKTAPAVATSPAGDSPTVTFPVGLFGATDTKKAPILAHVLLKGDLPESAGGAGLFGDAQTTLRDYLERLDKAANDKEVLAVMLDLRELAIGRGKVNEVRAKIAQLRKAGKKVYAVLPSAEMPAYLVASACDQVIMPESGNLVVTGVRIEVSFYKKLLDKLGVSADMMQAGRFKGAAEPLTREAMSPEFRKQLETVIDDYYRQLIDTIAADRKLDSGKVKDLIDDGLFSAADAKKAGLIDVVAYDDEVETLVKKDLGNDQIKITKNYAKKKQDTDFSGMAGMVKLLDLMMGGDPAKRTTKNKKIALVYVVGAIVDGESKEGLLGGASVGGDTIVKALRTAEEDATVVGIVLRVDSPGGSALASDLIWRQIRQSKKPIIASMGDTAASGGYYISMGCQKILAEEGTLTGSIGVVGGKVALKGLLDKVGVGSETISRGKNSGLFAASERFSDSERVVWQKMLNETYQQFIGKAAQGRKKSVEAIHDLAEGRVWTGKQAKANGLVDDVGTLEDAMKLAKVAAGLKEGEKVETLILPKQKNIFEQLLGIDDAEARVPKFGAQDLAIQSLESLVPGSGRQLRDAMQFQQLLSRPTLMMPMRIEVK